ncbi:MAG: hypothetical protein C5B54_10905 [Acidobacteria bacterium]|nr:MAG: hypothetical protein C5B54_10905 [Acidobacteriota bacterium]
MPTFEWSGRHKNGKLLSGKIEAAFEEEAVRKLRAQQIHPTSIRQIGSMNPGGVTTLPRTQSGTRSRSILTRLVLGVVLLIGAASMISVSTGSIIRCQSIVSGNPYQCAIETNMGGFYPMSSEQIRSAQSASAEEKVMNSYDSQKRLRGTRASRVIIKGDDGSISTPWMQYPYRNSEEIATELNAQLDHRSALSLEYRQIEIAPVVVGIICAIAGIWLLISSIRKLVQR